MRHSRPHARRRSSHDLSFQIVAPRWGRGGPPPELRISAAPSSGMCKYSGQWPLSGPRAGTRSEFDADADPDVLHIEPDPVNRGKIDEFIFPRQRGSATRRRRPRAGGEAIGESPAHRIRLRSGWVGYITIRCTGDVYITQRGERRGIQVRIVDRRIEHRGAARCRHLTDGQAGEAIRQELTGLLTGTRAERGDVGHAHRGLTGDCQL